MNALPQSLRRALPVGVAVGLGLYCAVAAAEQAPAPALVVGIVAWPGHDLTKATVQLYRDAECTKLACTSRKVGREGTYAIIVPEPATYYARLHVDENGSGTTDTGDGVGFYGLSGPAQLGSTPRPIAVAAGDVVPDVIVSVIATIGPDGTPQPLERGAAPPDAPPIVLGAVVWPGHELRNARVRLFADERLSNVAYESPPVEAGGSFAIVVDPGTYYACVTVDADGDGKFGPGDAVGYYGVTDMTDPDQRPKPIAAGPGHGTPHLVIPISAVLTQDGKLQAVEVPEEIARSGAQTASTTQIAGTVIWPEHTFEHVWVVAASSPRLRDVVGTARPEAESGRYTITLPTGDYVLAALVDANGSGRLDTGDCLGFRGGETAPGPEALLTPLHVREGEPATGLDLHIVARLADGGGVAPLGGGSLSGPPVKLDPTELPALVSGRLLWEGETIGQGTVTFFRNKQLSQVAAVVPVGSGGAYAAVLPPGTYYMMVGADRDRDGSMSPGDGLGVYGAGRMAAADARQPVALEGGALRAGLDVQVSDVVAEDGTLQAARP